MNKVSTNRQAETLDISAGLQGPEAVGGQGAAMERIRLLKFLTLFGIGGTEKQVVNLAMRIDRSMFDLSFGCLSRWGELIGEVEQGQGLAVTEISAAQLLRTQRLPAAMAVRVGAAPGAYTDHAKLQLLR